MRLHYCRTPRGNFGDDLNPWLWPRLAPGLLDDDASTEFLGIGTLLNSSLRSGPRRVVFSSGAGYGPPPQLDDSWTISCVRGPLTAARLGLPSSSAVTDGAALLAALPRPTSARHDRVAFMPHHRTADMADWPSLCAALDFVFVDPCAPVDDVLAAIAGARLLISEALHGAVAADALRVPWIAIDASSHVYSFKWEDWCASLDLAYRPHSLPPLQQRPLARGARLRNTAKRFAHRVGAGKAKWGRLPLRQHGRERADEVARQLVALAAGGGAQLSDERLLQRRVDELQNRLAALTSPSAFSPGHAAKN